MGEKSLYKTGPVQFSPWCHTHKCLLGQMMDTYGFHASSCPVRAGRLSCHSTLNVIIKKALVAAGFPAVLEPVGLSRRGGSRPYDLVYIKFYINSCTVTTIKIHFLTIQRDSQWLRAEKHYIKRFYLYHCWHFNDPIGIQVH